MKILIINSKEHWINGWMTSPKSLQIVLNTLQKIGCQVKTIEVEKIHELEEVLKKITKDTLVWANAYWVNGTNDKQYAINEQLEKYDVPFLGSNLNTLLKLLEKDTCQKVLKESNMITKAKGGEGAIREIIVQVLTIQDAWQDSNHAVW